MFDITEQSNRLHIRLSAALEKIDEVSKRIAGFLEKRGAQRYAFEIELLTREALINAVMHGSCADRSKTIDYEIRLEGNLLIMEVEDKGCGFDWSGRLEKEPEPGSESGRGLSIMKKYSTRMAYNSKGNRLVLIKTID